MPPEDVLDFINSAHFIDPFTDDDEADAIDRTEELPC